VVFSEDLDVYFCFFFFRPFEIQIHSKSFTDSNDSSVHTTMDLAVK